MTDDLEIWQQRIQELYTNVAALYAHVDITIAVFDRELGELSPNRADDATTRPLRDVAQRVLETGDAQRDIVLDQLGRRRAHGFPLRDGHRVIGAVCVVDDDGARRELFVRCAMAIFDGYRQNEAALLQREREAVAEAQRANRLRDQFLAVVSHELRMPLAAILLWEQVLRASDVDAATRKAALDAIHESATGQSLLVADLLDVARAITGKLHIDRRVTSLLRVLTMAIDNARPHAEALQLALRSELEPGLGHVLGDSRRLRQILDNLLSNATRRTAHGTISVRAWQDEESITVEVSDTGSGIDADYLPHVFEPFWQADPALAPEGLGLGLAVARQLVELHGGSLSAASEGPGRGATFTLRLPRVTASLAEEEAPIHQSITAIRVLIVDDDGSLLEALRRLLHDAGGIVATARSAAAAFDVLERGEIDVLVSDLGMRVEDGYSLVRRVRAAPGPMRTVPAIAITARISDESRTLALEAGFDHYMPKPIDIPLLLSTIAELSDAEPARGTDADHSTGSSK